MVAVKGDGEGLVMTSSGGHYSGWCVSCCNAFLLNFIFAIYNFAIYIFVIYIFTIYIFDI